MSNQIHQAVRHLFNHQEPTSRHEARLQAKTYMEILKQARDAQTLILEQLEVARDLHAELSAKLYPDRFTDNSTEATKTELSKLEKEIDQLVNASNFLGLLKNQASEKFNNVKQMEVEHALSNQNIAYRGL